MSFIQQEKVEQHIVLTLNRPDKRNALTGDMYADLAAALTSVKNCTDVKCVVLQGRGGHFTAGNDLSDFATYDPEKIKTTVSFMEALLDCPVPVVVKAEGMSVGIGVTLMLHCDFVVLSENTTLAMPFVNLGLVPEYAASSVLAKHVGEKKAREWLLLGDTFNAYEALESGLVTHVCEADELTAYTDALVKKIESKPRKSLVNTKALLNSKMSETKQHMRLELDIFSEHLQSEVAKEAFAAFLEKRQPDPEKYK